MLKMMIANKPSSSAYLGVEWNNEQNNKKLILESLQFQLLHFEFECQNDQVQVEWKILMHMKKLHTNISG